MNKQEDQLIQNNKKYLIRGNKVKHQLCFEAFGFSEIIQFYTIQQNCIKIFQSKMQSDTPTLKKKQSMTKQNFSIIKKLGRGAYGNVHLVIKDNISYAMKQIQKKKLAKQNKQYQAMIQKELLSKMKHPGIIKLNYSFQDNSTLYFILQYCQGGSFTQFMYLHHKELTNEIKIFYVAQIVQILQYLHKNGVTHRDLKPQNIMLSKDGHLKLIDFGTADVSKCKLVSQQFKQNIYNKKKMSTAQSQRQIIQNMEFELNSGEESPSPTRTRRATFVGTSYYISPQLLEFNICEPPADLWALGCIIYQLFYLEPAFKDVNQFEVFQRIKRVDVPFPNNNKITEQGLDLIKKLLVKNPSQRLGCNQNGEIDYSVIKKHPFFKQTNFETIFIQPVPEAKQKPTNIQQHKQKIQRTKTQFQKFIKQQVTKQKNILIHGILEKKTFLTYTMYYFIVYNNLTMLRIKCEEPDKERNMKIKYKSFDKKDKKQSARLTDQGKFDLITYDKIYTLKAESNQIAKKWVETINARAKELLLSFTDSSDSD